MQRFRRCADWLAGAVVRVLELGMQVSDVCDEVSERACRVVPRSHRVARSFGTTAGGGESGEFCREDRSEVGDRRAIAQDSTR